MQKWLFEEKKVSGAYKLIDNIIRNGTKYIFGYPGGAILPIYDELYLWEKNNLIKHILVRHEQGAAHAADAFARASGEIGVCFATSGPGATNLVTGIATAQMDSIPLVIITGQVGKSFIGTDAFQETDIFGITLPLVKHSYVVRDPREMPYIVTKSYYIAQNGRPGPVLIDVPKDVGLEECKNVVPIYQKDIAKKIGYRFRSSLNRALAYKLITMLANSMEPLLYLGGGVITSEAQGEVKELCNRFNVPATTTLMGKGSNNEKDPLALGMLGMHGTPYANFAISDCDLLIAIGARFDDRVTGKLEKFATNAKIIHIDIDPAEISKNKTPYFGIIGDVKLTIREILKQQLLHKLPLNHYRSEWLKKIKRWRQAYALCIPKTEKVSPQKAIRTIGEQAKGAFFTTDVGQHQMWSAQFVKCDPRRWLSSSGLGTMGYGLPAAIGAQIAFPNSLVCCISGDSSFQMNLQELGTISQYNLPIKIFIINNGWQGMVRQWQQSFYGERYSHSNMSNGVPNFNKLGEAYGIKSVTVDYNTNLMRQIKDILDFNGPVLVNIPVIEDENCYPMVKPGKSNGDMMGLMRIERASRNSTGNKF